MISRTECVFRENKNLVKSIFIYRLHATPERNKIQGTYSLSYRPKYRALTKVKTAIREQIHRGTEEKEWFADSLITFKLLPPVFLFQSHSKPEISVANS